MTDYYPDRWAVISIKQGDNDRIFKVLGSWYGGYLDGDSYRLNSGIAEVEEEEFDYIFTGYSGSRYFCHKNRYGLNSVAIAWLNQFTCGAKEHDDISIDILTDKADFVNLSIGG